MKIVIAGASGYVGHVLIQRLLERYPEAHITALSRSPRESDNPRLVWRACDLFSLRQLEEAFPDDVDVAYYLVHSMQPTAHLDQGSFGDYDLILADNFARLLKIRKITQLIYLSGLTPENESLSAHLESRLEVQLVFEEYKLPSTILRAGLILGPGGSSFQILLKLVRRLPAMVCPGWTKTLTTPVDLDRVIEALVECASDPKHIGKVYDLAGCAPLTYAQMMQQTAQLLGLRRKFIHVPFITPTLSRMWVAMITRTDKGLVYPLIESLKHKMIIRPSHAWPGNSSQTYKELFKSLPREAVKTLTPSQFKPHSGAVRSVQRMHLPKGRDAEWVRNEYQRWLPRYLRFIIYVYDLDRGVTFCLLYRKWELLVLRLSKERSRSDRQLMYIIGGSLAEKNTPGRFEFREVLGRKYILAAIHEFRPTLPWFIYQWTQAKVHLFVMRAFGRHLNKF